jgi:hypothetical protein
MKIIPIELQEGMPQVVTEIIDEDGNEVTILLPEFILGNAGRPRPSPKHRIKHKNGNWLDNQKHNLEWVIPERMN